jgi:hypothetical protein
MRMDYIEGANEILGLKDMVHKRPTHVVDFCYEIRIQLKRTAVIMDPVDPIVVRLAMSYPGEDMHFMSFPVKGSRKLGDVSTYAADSDRVK